jgi:pimeloyl-ACP methyl ester carboxylesterase
MRTGKETAQSVAFPASKMIQTSDLEIGYEDEGNPQSFPIILLHGFPDDIRAWDDVVPPLIKAGYRALRPYLRGYGATRFRNNSAMRNGEQAAIGQDVLDFADALRLRRFAIVGYDWGGRAASIVAALHPDRVRAAVIIGGYTIQNTLTVPQPGTPEVERERWYQWYFNTDVGRAGLATNRRSLSHFLWETWSPDWHFSESTFNRTAPSFDNPDFADVVIHSYRHRIANAPGDPRFKEVERRLAERPNIPVASFLLYGANDPLVRPSTETTPAERSSFPLLKAKRVIDNAGHFLPREKPDAVSSAMLEVLEATTL